MTEKYPHTEHERSTESDLDNTLSYELPFNNHEVGIATTTFYPKWQQTEETEGEDSGSVDKVRGDLALEAITAAIHNGYQLVVVDGGSSEAFVQSVRNLGVEVQEEEERGMSPSRRQAFEAVAELDDVRVICWTEPEKVSITRDCIVEAVKPIFEGDADIVVPRRDAEAFATYPDYQADFEMTSNHLWNNILRRHHLLAENAKDIDAWVGPRFFKNDPEILRLFTAKYEYISDMQSGLKKDAPELWPNALFLPLIIALKEGYRVKGVDVPYRHPAEQAAIEQDSEVFRQKRALQQENILKTTIHFIRYLEAHPQARMKQF